ncbi:HET-E1, partial [Symbiodinium necroappetens]
MEGAAEPKPPPGEEREDTTRECEGLGRFRVPRGETASGFGRHLAQATGQVVDFRLVLEGSVPATGQTLLAAGLQESEVLVVKGDRLIATASHDGSVKIFRADTGQCLQTLLHEDAVFSASFSHSAQQVLTTSGWTGRIWSLNGDVEVSLIGHTGAVVSGSFAPDDRLVVTSSSHDNTGRIWCAQTGACVRVLTGYELAGASFTPDGTMVLAACSWEDCALLWSLETGEVLRTFQPHSSAVLSASISPDGFTVATACWNGELHLWWADSGRCRASLTGPDQKSKVHVAFSPDGGSLVSASIHHVAQVWELSGALRLELPHGNSVTSAGFSPDGAWIVSSSYDGTAKIWNSRTGDLVRTLQGHADAVRSACFARACVDADRLSEPKTMLKNCCQCDEHTESNEATIHKSLPAMTDEDPDEANAKFVETAEVGDGSTGKPTEGFFALPPRLPASSQLGKESSYFDRERAQLSEMQAKEPLFFLYAVAWGTSQTAQYGCRLAQPPYEMESLSRSDPAPSTRANGRTASARASENRPGRTGR